MTAIPKAPVLEDGKEYLKHLRGQPCILSFQPAIAAHIRWDGDYRVQGFQGTGRKPLDCYAVPLAKHLHDEQHNVGEVQFWSDAFAIEGFRMWLLKDWARLKYEEWKRGG